MVASVRGMLGGAAQGGAHNQFDYEMALQKFGALAYVASEADLCQLALANIRPAVAALASRSGGGNVDASLLLLLKWGQGSKNRHFVDLHCHATALPAPHDAAVATSIPPCTIDAYAIPNTSLSSARSSTGTSRDGGRSGIRSSWLDAGVDLS
jgi:hypothetical protein